jgi:phosphoglycolate phosphatase-like HAD superfamily hydrolase
MKLKLSIELAVVAMFCATTVTAVFAADPLPSWNDSKSKSAIVHFVEAVTKENGPSFVAPAERIATFDNDGTLWLEQPMYPQLLFALQRLNPNYHSPKAGEPVRQIIEQNLAVLSVGVNDIAKTMMTTDGGATEEEFTKIAKHWLDTTEDARFKRRYTQLIYQPMLELLTYLRSNGFKTYIVSGGGIEFMRTFTEKCYGIPPEQVIGSSVKTKFEYRNGKPVIVRVPELDFNDDKEGKPLGIERIIGRRPLAAFGNSDGDLEMLQWTAGGAGPHFCLYVHHTDAVREYAYDRTSKVGHLDQGLDEAAKQGWTVVDMKNDWKTIFPPDSK